MDTRIWTKLSIYPPKNKRRFCLISSKKSRILKKIITMEKTWRWFGKKDRITLAMLQQIGVEGIVTALHDVPLGEVWTREKIHDLKEYIESYGMRWSVVESLPVVETIKYGGPDRDYQIEVYKQSLRNLLQLYAGAGLGPDRPDAPEPQRRL